MSLDIIIFLGIITVLTAYVMIDEYKKRNKK